MRLKKHIFSIIGPDSERSLISTVFDMFIISLISINVIIVILETFDGFPDWLLRIFYWVELVSVIIFTIEYALRIWTADMLYTDKKPWRARLTYASTFMGIIDILAIIPFYLPFFIAIDMRVLRMLRLLRLLRLFKMNRYTTAFASVGSVLKRKSAQLVSSMLVLFILIVMASILMYAIENADQPDNFKNAFSGLWWAISTLTTVGYGDIYPITNFGQALGALIAMFGIALVAIPTGIISAGFMEESQKTQKGMDILQKERENAENEEKDEICYCPYCGKWIKSERDEL